MDKEKLLALLLPGLSGSLSFCLNDQQLVALMQELLQEKASYIKSIASKDGYIQLELTNPLVKKLDLKIVSIEISSTKLIASIRILNIMPLFLTPVIGLLGKIGFNGKMKGDDIVVDFSNKWQKIIAPLPPDGIRKFNSLSIQIDSHSNALAILISINGR